jgi:non-lysosomal glucosylceramidase
VGFHLRLLHDTQGQTRVLNQAGWRDVTFTGEYPIGFVEYRDPDAPVSVSLEACSPFIPLNVADSSLPPR